jgi:dienelactone hydrolase
MANEPTAISDYDKFVFKAALTGGKMVSHDVYQRGTGAPVVLIQELPGIGVETLQLADELVGAGLRVFMPHLFGPIGKTSLLGNTLRVFCMRKEFHIFQANRSSPIIDWLKALCREMKSQHSAKGVGVIGMCLTGNFAISLLADDSVLAAVASQPSIPIGKHADLHMSDAEITPVKQRLDATAPMKALRFEGDPMCTAAKFESIDKHLNGDGNTRVELHARQRALCTNFGFC